MGSDDKSAGFGTVNIHNYKLLYYTFYFAMHPI